MSGFTIYLDEGLGSLAHVRLTTVQGEPLLDAEICLQEQNTVISSRIPGGVAAPFLLPGLGRFYLWANDRDKGFRERSYALSLADAWIADRKEHLKKAIRTYSRKGLPLHQAQQHWENALSANEITTQICELVRASESLSREVAITRLKRLRERLAFLWGAHLLSPTEEVSDVPLNTLAIPVGSPDDWMPAIQRAHQERKVLLATEIVCPARVQSLNPKESAEYFQEVLTRYRGWIRYWEVVSDVPATLEALGLHGSRAIDFLEELCKPVRALDASSVRLLGFHHGLYRHQGGMSLIDTCIDEEVPFEAIHLTLYWHDGDLFYFDQLLERYGDFGKPLYVSVKLPPENRSGEFWREDTSFWIDSFCWLALSKPFVVGVLFDNRYSEPLYGDLQGAVSTLLKRGYNPLCDESLE